MTTWTLLPLVAIALVVSTAQAPKAVALRQDDDQPARAAPTREGPPIVQLDEDSQEKGGIAISAPAPAVFQDNRRVYGSVLTLDRLTALYNSALTARSQLEAAEAKLAASRTANDRAQALLKIFSTAKAQAEAASATLALDTIAAKAARTELDIVRNSAIQEWGERLGTAIAERSPLAQDLVLRRLCLVQITFEPDDTGPPPPRLSLPLGGTTAVDATLLSPAPQVDPRVQGQSYLYVAAAAPALAPGRNLVATVPRGPAAPGLDIPPSAVVWQAGRAWMFLRTAPTKFERRPLDRSAVPTADGGFVIPAQSLPADQKLVVDGAQVLLSQESRAQIPTDEDDN
jgi:hypothetical protein